jgi:hypothetical protein
MLAGSRGSRRCTDESPVVDIAALAVSGTCISIVCP